jgi:OOP family OmpA-OmpF porin
MRRAAPFLALAAFALAAVLATATALLAARAIEARSVRLIERLLAAQGIDWADVAADGLAVTLTGTAPTEALRFRAVSLAGTVVGGNRVIDALGVVPSAGIAVPDFLLEILRNDDGISLIGLVPQDWDGAAFGAAAAAAGLPLSDMLQRAAHAAPEGWDAAVAWAHRALAILPRSKISVAAGRVTVTAIADTPAHQREIEAALGRLPGAGDLALRIDIAAPRPVITPFTLRFVIDDRGARFDACSAANERGRDRIIAAGVAAGATGRIACTLGLGAPSPRWAEASAAAIAALAELGQGTLTMSDTDITLIAHHATDPARFDAAVGRLQASLPEVFSLSARRADPPAEAAVVAAPQFTATRAADGTVELRGRIADDRLRDAADAFARARFGADAVRTALRVDPAGLPPAWSVRVLAGLSALALLADGAVLVEAGHVTVRGRTGDQAAQAEIARLLGERLGQGAAFTVDVAYDPGLDPATGRPTPETCVAEANAILARGKIAFAPGSAEVPESARPTLEALAALLRNCPEAPIEIGGHTDSQGREENNLTLSERRAEAVRRALFALRVPVAGITARGYGAAEPIADNATEAGREANRRITFRLVGPPAAPQDAPEDAPVAAAAAVEPPPEATAAAVPQPAPRPRAAPETGARAPADAGDNVTHDSPGDGAALVAEALAAPPDAEAPSFAPATPTRRPQRRPAE